MKIKKSSRPFIPLLTLFSILGNFKKSNFLGTLPVWAKVQTPQLNLFSAQYLPKQKSSYASFRISRTDLNDHYFSNRFKSIISQKSIFSNWLSFKTRERFFQKSLLKNQNLAGAIRGSGLHIKCQDLEDYNKGFTAGVLRKWVDYSKKSLKIGCHAHLSRGVPHVI